MKYISHKKIIAIKLFGRLLNVNNLNLPNLNINDYIFIKDLTPKEANEDNRVSIYKKKNELFVFKKHNIYLNNMDTVLIVNEANIMSRLNDVFYKSKVKSPKYYGLYKHNNNIVLVAKFENGKNLSFKQSKLLLIQLESVLKYLKFINDAFNSSQGNKFLKKDNFYFFTIFIYYLLRSIYKNKHIVISKLFYKFILNMFKGNNDKKYYLAHGGLYTDSILYDSVSQNIIIVDWESSLLSKKYYDLAFVVVHYFGKINNQLLIDFINKFIKNKRDLSSFLYLCMFFITESYMNNVFSEDQVNNFLNFSNKINLNYE